jgi:hypothetical protein
MVVTSLQHLLQRSVYNNRTGCYFPLISPSFNFVVLSEQDSAMRAAVAQIRSTLSSAVPVFKFTDQRIGRQSVEYQGGECSMSGKFGYAKVVTIGAELNRDVGDKPGGTPTGPTRHVANEHRNARMFT